MEINNDEDIEKYFNEKVPNDDNLDDLEEEDLDHDEGILPKMSDPKVFAVTCKPGLEKETVA